MRTQITRTQMMRTRIVRPTLVAAAAAVVWLAINPLVSAAPQAPAQNSGRTSAPSAAPASTPARGSAQAPAFKAKKLTRVEFDALLQDPARILIVDVRRPDELQAIGGFPAFLSIQAAQLEQSLAFVPKDRTIVTVSNHANRAGRAADLLEARGFTVAGAIGAQDYEAEGGTLVKIAKPAPRPAAAPSAR